MNIIVRVILLTLLIGICSACRTPEEKRKDAIKTFISNLDGKNQKLNIISMSYDSIYSTQRNINNIEKIQNIILLRDSTLLMLKNFKISYADLNNRVWLKNITGESRTIYQDILNKEDKMCSLINNLAVVCNSDPNLGTPQHSVLLKYNSNGTKKYGLFIFDNNYKITSYKILTEEEYTSINHFIHVAQADATDYIPYFENVGIDIVPEDEDPSLTPEERKQLKAEQEFKRVAEQRAKIRKTNPLPKTFFGATLGKTPINIILRRLRNEGWEVTQLCNYSYSEYYCSNWRDYMYGLSYNVIRIYAQNGIFDKIEFINDFTPEWGSRKRYYGQEIEDAFRRAKSSASKKFGFWRHDYENEKFDDDITTLTVASYGNCVSYTFARKNR